MRPGVSANLQTSAPSYTADLKACVRTVFSQFGPIVDVVAKKTYKLRGQAWVGFERAEDAERAIKLMQGFPFYGQALVRCWSVLRWLHWSVCLGPGSRALPFRKRVAESGACKVRG